MDLKRFVTSHAPLRDHLADAILRAIVVGKLTPGQRLTEAELARQFNSSRAPVREALRELNQVGLVEHSPYRGSRVASITEVEVRDVLLPIRTVLEVFALRQFLEDPDDESWHVLEETVRAIRSAASTGARSDVVEQDLAFHHQLMRAAAYPHPLRIWKSIAPVMQRALYVGTTEDSLLRTAEEHEVLLDAMRSGDTDKAEEILLEHIAEMEKKFVKQRIDFIREADEKEL